METRQFLNENGLGIYDEEIKAYIANLGIGVTYTLSQDATDGHTIIFTPSVGNPTRITIPDNNTTYSNLSEFTNDVGFITNAVNDLVNYYKSSETYTKAEIDNKISAIPKFAISVVLSLPTENISDTTIYLVTTGEESENLYTEYIHVNGRWEKLGTQTIDLSGYAKTADLGALAFKDSLSKSDVGLGNVPNVATNDQTPTYSDATTLATLTSGEKLSVAFGKIKKAISDLISHIANKSNPHSVTASQVGLGNVENKSSATIRGELTKDNVTSALGYTPPTADTNNAVTQTTSSTTNADYRILLSATADDTTRTEGARKDTDFKYNPSTNNLMVGKINGVEVGSNPKFTDTTSLASMSGTLAVGKGGTGSTSAAGARTNLGVEEASTYLSATLSVGSTTVTFNNSILTGNKPVNVYTSVPGLNYTNISYSGTSITLTYEKQSSAVTVYLEVKHAI